MIWNAGTCDSGLEEVRLRTSRIIHSQSSGREKISKYQNSRVAQLVWVDLIKSGRLFDQIVGNDLERWNL